MSTSKTKIWIGLGAFVLSANSTQSVIAIDSAPAQQDAPTSPLAPAYLNGASLTLASLTGEGGEGGEAGAAAGANPDEAYMTKLMLMQGHLRIGHALVKGNNRDDAVMHFMHPVEEIYSSLEPDLEKHNVPPFKSALNDLADRARSQTGKEAFDQAYQQVQQHLETAIQALEPSIRQQPTFRLNVALRLLQQAAMEYVAAIQDGQIVNVAEYQDSRGFVWTAEELLLPVADALQARNAEKWQSLQNELQSVKQAWPTVEPPTAPALSVSQVLSTISRIELDAGQLQ